MKKKMVLGVFDIGKTNKKFLLLDNQLDIIEKTIVQLPETIDEDLYPCEDELLLRDWMLSCYATVMNHKHYQLVGLNFSAYGATFIHLGIDGNAVCPIYNYLKPFDEKIQFSLYQKYGGKESFCLSTASPALGNLNSGLTLYWLKQQRPDIFKNVHVSLHLPEYCSYLFTGKLLSGLSSIGCHTHLWDFDHRAYHSWVREEGLLCKLAPISADENGFTEMYAPGRLLVGNGIHDSSAAVIPYLFSTSENFILLSTGTWCIAMNPFNTDSLTAEEMDRDVLKYLLPNGNAVRAARFFAGRVHDEMVTGLISVYNASPDFYKHIKFDEGYFLLAEETDQMDDGVHYYNQPGIAQAYHLFLYAFLKKLAASIKLAMGSSKIGFMIITGGFSNNHVFTEGLKYFFPTLRIMVSENEDASAMGAAMMISEKAFQGQELKALL